jgi:S1/P1 Nuclease
MRRRWSWLLCVALLLPLPLFAWNKGGHMVSAAVAYHVLKHDSPQTMAKVVAILKEHPQYESSWLPRLNAMVNATEDDKEMMLFMQAARWPDDARANEEFHHSHWHYINMPFKPEGQPESVHSMPPDHDNILRAYVLNLDKVKDQREDPEERAVAMCWVFHLIGDAHQPLHVAQLFSTQYPKGDRGGNKFYIHAKQGASAITLHQYWDDLVIGSDRFQSVRNKATELRNHSDLAQDKLTELSETHFEKWAATESFKLAKEVAYRHGKLAGGTELADAVVLPDDYSHTVKPVAERRIVLAGYRIAAVMKKALE